MFENYLVECAIILLPITAYLIWTFGKSFYQMPFRTVLMGLYGGGAAILCQLVPVQILSHTENFQCVPIILSILYGKRKSGFVSVLVLSLYELFSAPIPWIAIVAILFYSAFPMIICNHFEYLQRRQKLRAALLLNVVTVFLELLFIIVYYSSRFGQNSWSILLQYTDLLVLTCTIQLVLMGFAFYLLETILANGRIQKGYESLIAFNPLGICAFNMNREFISTNPAYEKLTGYKESELVGKTNELVWPRANHLNESTKDRIYQGEIIKDLETTIRHKDGRKIPVLCTLVPMINGDTVFGFYAMVTDISESKMNEELLRNSEKLSAVGQLAAGVAHEIRNPLTSIKGFLQLLSSESTSKQKHYYHIMESELSRIEGIISEMLVLAKPQALKFQPLRVKDHLEEVINLLEAQAHLQNVEIVRDYEIQDACLMGDQNQLKQVFLNLTKNAMEAMSLGGTLTISLFTRNEQLIIEFVDEGDGIPEEVINRIGEPFFTTKKQGTGLGLLMSKRIIENHKGEMAIRSIENVGTTFTLSFPLIETVSFEPKATPTAPPNKIYEERVNLH